MIARIFIRGLLINKNKEKGTSLVVQWLRLRPSTAGDWGSIPGQGAKIVHPACRHQEKKEEN